MYDPFLIYTVTYVGVHFHFKFHTASTLVTTSMSCTLTENVVDLVEEGCSIPFIARYRKERTNNMEADKIREVVAKLEELK